MREIRLRYLWQEYWYYIDLYKDNTALKFKEYEDREKTTRFEFWTGRKDKNGKEIYEGNIVKCRLIGEKDYWKGTINFNQGYFRVNLLPLAMIEDIEIIGNIHQNPELIRQFQQETKE